MARWLGMLLMPGLMGEMASEESPTGDSGFRWQTEQFADLRILRYRVPGFESLPLQQKRLLYYLSQAGLCGRDIIYDQNYRHNLRIRRTLEAIHRSHRGERAGPEREAFLTYLKRVWFSNGIHHHYSTRKFVPGFSPESFRQWVLEANPALLPLGPDESPGDLVRRLRPILFDPQVDARRVNKDAGADPVADSANNYYEGVTRVDVEEFYRAMIPEGEDSPISYGLNSKLLLRDGVVRERVWKLGGMYTEAIEHMVYWLEKAVGVAENARQRRALELLIAYYRTGQLRTFDHYSIAWVADTDSSVDAVHGFIEVYGDAMGYRGAYEAMVSLRDPEASRRIDTISRAAQWFEDRMPIMEAHRKPDVRGISARVINVVINAGDVSPASPIGVNLPNADWIRARHGSKSVNLANIVQAHDEASKSSGLLEEFAADAEEAALSRKWGMLAHNLHVDMHEVIGHASGRIDPGVGTPKETLGSYASTLEEARADLVALYFAMNPKLVELGLMPSPEVGREACRSYLRNGLLVQLRRIEPGEDIEEDHMRNRQLVCRWVLEKGGGKVVALERREGRTLVRIGDYDALTTLFGELLREIQRIKSEGDLVAGRELVERYGVRVDPELHREVLARVESLDIAPYAGFINPDLEPVIDAAGEIVDVRIHYPEDFAGQQLGYSERYSFLPEDN